MMMVLQKILFPLSVISVSVITFFIFGIGVADAEIKCCHWEEDPPSTLSSNVDYGYVTVLFESIPFGDDGNQDARSWYKWPEGSEIQYVVNTDGINGVTESEALQIIQDAENDWYQRLADSSSIPPLQFDDETNNIPSYLQSPCGVGSDFNNDENEIGFCDLTGIYETDSGLAFREITQVGANFSYITESDIVLNTDVGGSTPWSTSELFSITQHEFGHFYGLGDLYQFHTSQINNCNNGETPTPLMCRKSVVGEIQNGDRDGIKFLYPKEHSFSLPKTGTISGTDSAVGLISPITGCIPPSSGDWILSSSCTLAGSATAPASLIVESGVTLTIPNTKTLGMDFNNYHLLIENTGKVMINSGGKITSSDVGFAADPDLLFVWGDFSSSTTSIKVTPIWDLSRTSGIGTIGTTSTLFSVSGQVLDIGATIANVDGDSNQDLIVSYILPTSPDPLTFYKVFFDITRSAGDGVTIGGATSVQEIGDDLTFREKGTDVVVFDIDNNGSQDLVVTNACCTDPLYQLFYYYGPLSTSGTVSTWTSGPSNSSFTFNSADVGFAVVDSDARIGTLTYGDTTTSNFFYARDHVFHFANDASISDSIIEKHTPLKQIPQSPNGIGSGDAIDIGELAYNDKITSWTDSTKGYYTIDWDTRLYSHG